LVATLAHSNYLLTTKMQYHLYSADTQLYLSFNPCYAESVMARQSSCFVDIRAWMEENLLKINDCKTEHLVIGNPSAWQRYPSSSYQLRLMQLSDQPAPEILWSTLILQSFKTFIIKTAASAMYHDRPLLPSAITVLENSDVACALR